MSFARSSVEPSASLLAWPQPSPSQAPLWPFVMGAAVMLSMAFTLAPERLPLHLTTTQSANRVTASPALIRHPPSPLRSLHRAHAGLRAPETHAAGSFRSSSSPSLSLPLAFSGLVAGLVLASRWLRLRPGPQLDTMSMLTLSAKRQTESIANGAEVSKSKLKAKIKRPVFVEKCERVGITLTRFVNEMVRANPDLSEIEAVFASIQTAGKAIAKLVARAPLDGMLGRHGGINSHGEEQKKLDVITNDLLKRVLKYTGRMGVLASEEEDHPVPVDNTAPGEYELDIDDEEGRFVTVFDPLDGSSNVDASIPVGTIFGIFEREEGCHLPENLFMTEPTEPGSASQQCLRRTLRPGRSLVAAGYVLYSTSTYFVFTVGAGLHAFVLDQSVGEFILVEPHIQIPNRGYIYSINGANRRTWDKPMQVFIDSLADGTNKSSKEYTSRYIGSMVGDIHRTLMYGGVFAYPADCKSPNGKLRLLYEASPMSFIVEQAGGKSSTGVVRIMDILPKSVHQRVPCIMGGVDEVEECEQWYQRLGGEKLLAAHKALITPDVKKE